MQPTWRALDDRHPTRPGHPQGRPQYPDTERRAAELPWPACGHRLMGAWWQPFDTRTPQARPRTPARRRSPPRPQPGTSQRSSGQTMPAMHRAGQEQPADRARDHHDRQHRSPSQRGKRLPALGNCLGAFGDHSATVQPPVSAPCSALQRGWNNRLRARHGTVRYRDHMGTVASRRASAVYERRRRRSKETAGPHDPHLAKAARARAHAVTRNPGPPPKRFR
jgi:hypothetical protein